MENRKDYEKLLGERLEDAYMREDFVPVMSREEFHRLIQTAEKKKRARRALMSFAVVCVALCLVWGGFIAGMTMRESASAGRDDESKTMQQGDSMVIGSGVSEDDENVGVSTKTYTNIDDIPEDIRNEICFLDSDEFELEKVKVVKNKAIIDIVLYYFRQEVAFAIKESVINSKQVEEIIASSLDESTMYQGIPVYINKNEEGVIYMFTCNGTVFSIMCDKPLNKKNIEAIINGLAI
ncbi:MAG: hypothetical protein PUD12_03550 [Firmicutes bacterium]|nr:hypothetical protein [Bacillota bacterium]